MERGIARSHEGQGKREAGLNLRPPDLVVTLVAIGGVTAVLVFARWAPAASSSLTVFALLAVGALAFRALEHRFPGKGLGAVASFWLLPASVLGHGSLGPLADSVQPVLADRVLAYADLWLIGVHPSVWLDGRVPPWLMEALLYCYYTYFLWPVLLGLVLYRRRDPRIFERFVLALSLVYATNFVFYLLVPAVGPRFYLWDEFRGPLEGLWLTPLLESLMRTPPFMRDCFPSGHTAVTLTVLIFAFWHARRVFYLMLPVASGLIFATLAGRFHYAVDLVAAVPLVIVCVSTAIALYRQEAHGLLLVPSPGFAVLRRGGLGGRLFSRNGNRRSTA